MTAGKKKPEEKKTDTPGSTRSLRDNAEEHLARSPKSSPELKEKSPGQLIHELQVHQIELETQAEELRRAHLALEESRDKYLSLYEFAPIGYLTLTDTALIAEVNLFGAALLGIERKKLLNARFRKFIAQKDSERWVQYFMDVLDQGEKQVCTLMLKRVDDSMFPARLEGVRASDSNGATIVRVTFSDISDIWQIEAVAESEKRLRSYIDNAPDGVFIADETGRYLEVNPAACLITGYKKEELLAMRIPDLLPPESLEASAKHFNEVITSGQGSGELQFRHKDGSLRYWSVDAVRLSPTRFIGFVKDITVRKQAEEALVKSRKQLIKSEAELRIHQAELESQAEKLQKSHLALGESRDQYLDLYEFAPLGYFTLTGKALIAEVNLTCATLLGVERGKLLMKPFRKCVVEDNSDLWYKYFMQILKQEGRQVCTPMLKRGEGSMFPARLEGVRLTSSGGAITVRVAIIDITDIRQSEEAVHEAQMRTETILEGIADTFYSLDDEWRFSMVNPAAEKAPFGMPASELIGRVIWEVYPGLVGTRIHQHYLDAAKNHSLEHYDSQSPLNGRWYEVFMQGRTGGVDVYMRDITERKQAEKALQENEEKYRGIFDESVAAVYVFDNKKNFINSNQAGLDLLGYSREELLQLSIPDVDVDPVVVLPAHQALLSGGRLINYEHRLRRKDETIISVINNSSPLTDVHGNVVGIISTLIDITDRRKAEDSLRRVNQKLNVLSQLTRTELISQIFLLDGYVEMAKSYAAGQDRIIETLQKGEKAIRLLRGTIAYSKDYQDMGVTPPVWQNVKRTMLFGLSHLPISNINHSLETENLEVFADPLLEKACQRLFENSLAHGGHVSRIRVWHTVTPDGVNLFFEDDGIGIPVEMKEQIFLHDDTRTSVRGLFFIREILDITGITIRETGEPGKGARFEMAVPKGMWRITGDGA